MYAILLYSRETVLLNENCASKQDEKVSGRKLEKGRLRRARALNSTVGFFEKGQVVDLVIFTY